MVYLRHELTVNSPDAGTCTEIKDLLGVVAYWGVEELSTTAHVSIAAIDIASMT